MASLEEAEKSRIAEGASIAASPQNEIPRVLNSLGDELGKIEAQVEYLSDKLRPVTRREPSRDSEIDSAPANTDLGEYLNSFTYRLNVVRGRLEELNDKVEL